MIERRDIPDVRLTDPASVMPPEIRRTAELNYEYAIDRRNPFWKRVKAFLRGETKVGRTVGAIADIATIFLPGGVKTGREALQTIIQRKQKAMPILTDKPWYESKTLWGCILTILFAILYVAGIDVTANPELTDTILQIAMILSGSFSFYGIRDAIGKKREELRAISGEGISILGSDIEADRTYLSDSEVGARKKKTRQSR